VVGGNLDPKNWIETYRSMRLALTVGYRTLICDNTAFVWDFMAVLHKHSKHLDLIELVSIGVDKIQCNFQPLKRQIEAWQSHALNDDRAKLILYAAFVGGAASGATASSVGRPQALPPARVRGGPRKDTLEPFKRLHACVQRTQNDPPVPGDGEAGGRFLRASTGRASSAKAPSSQGRDSCPFSLQKKSEEILTCRGASSFSSLQVVSESIALSWSCHPIS